MSAYRITEALGLPPATGDLTPLTYSSSQTWTLDTTDGRVLLKHTPHTPPEAVSYEHRARAAGVDTPRPLTPAPITVPGLGPVRAYEWLDGRPPTRDDDLSTWLGHTLARLHGIDRTSPAGPDWYHLHDSRWQAWLAAGHDRPWAAPLRHHLPDITLAAAHVHDVFTAATDHVTTHRDVEMHNILITAAGPVLLDWDSAGPDSAGLEAAHAIHNLAGHQRSAPDPDTVRRALHAYTEAGATAPTGAGILARRLGIRLGRLAERLRISLGDEPAGPRDLRENENRAIAQIRSIPTFTRQLRTDADLFT